MSVKPSTDYYKLTGNLEQEFKIIFQIQLLFSDLFYFLLMKQG